MDKSAITRGAFSTQSQWMIRQSIALFDKLVPIRKQLAELSSRASDGQSSFRL